MSNVIKIKRGSGSDPSASDMALGEPVLRTDTAELFFKKDDGSVAKVSGGGGGPNFKYLELRNAANNGSASYPANDFTLVSAGTTSAITPAAANTLLVSVSGVIQKPNSGTSTSGITGFIVDGSRLKTATNLPAAPDFIIYQESGGIGEPSDNTVTSAKIVDGAIVNADINASAAIDLTKLNSGTLPNGIAVTSNNIGAGQLVTGAIAAGTGFQIVNNNVNNSAAIAGTKISPDFGSQDVSIASDSNKFLAGASEEMQVFHNGTNSVIKDTRDSGKVRIQADNFDFIDKDASGVILSATSSGLSVTGNITVSGTVDGIDIATDVAANTAKVTNATHTGDVTGATSLTIANDVVTFAKLQNVASQTIFGRAGGGTGDPTALSASDVRSIINVEDGATADQSNSQIKTAYEANSNTNAFTDTLLSKLNGIAASATNVTNTNQLTNGAGFITSSSNISGNAATATKLAATKTIAGVAFDGSANISLNNNAITNGAGYVTSSGNTIIGTDSDINTSGATVIDQLNMTDGVIQSHSTRTMTLADLGYTGATNANNITNNNQLTNGAGYITSSSIPTVTGAAKKFVNFNGTGSVSIRNDLGVSSISDHGAGQYTVNFDGNFANTNYTITHGTYRGSGGILYHFDIDNSISTGSHRFMISRGNNVGNMGLVAADTDQVHLAFFLN